MRENPRSCLIFDPSVLIFESGSEYLSNDDDDEVDNNEDDDDDDDDNDNDHFQKRSQS